MSETRSPLALTVLAVVGGKPLTEMPTDLFIPPDALEVLLDSFTGPLDLLLYLIRQQNINILDIPMAIITQQYMQYIGLLEECRLELAADYLVMAALLIEIKSKLLLPVSVSPSDEIEEDPRMALVRRLQAYEQIKQAALLIDLLPRLERDVFQIKVSTDCGIIEKMHPDVDLSSIVAVMCNLMKREQQFGHHQISRERLSVRERMVSILNRLQKEKLIEFSSLLNPEEGRTGIVVTLLALLELAKQALATLTQASPYSAIYLGMLHE
jgi:segregation and condensation protein A